MKKIILFVSAAIFSLGATSCSDDDNPSGTTTAKVRETIREGEWRISSLIKDSQDITADFNGYAFDFSENGVTATKGTDTFTGSYTLPEQTSSSNGHKVLYMYFADVEDFAILNDHWRIIKRTDEKLTLKYVDQDTEDDTLILEKN